MQIILLQFYFQVEHKKVYEPEEDRERFEIFKTNVKRIVEHNEKFERGEVTYSMGINQFADKKPGENRFGLMTSKPTNPDSSN